MRSLGSRRLFFLYSLLILSVALLLWPLHAAPEKVVADDAPLPPSFAMVRALVPKKKAIDAEVMGSQDGSTVAITAESALVQDLESGTVLFGRNMQQQRSPASTTKLLTVLVGLETFPEFLRIRIPQGVNVGGAQLGLRPDTEFAVSSLVDAIMISSANDAAMALALQYPSGLSGFVVRMNSMATELGMNSSSFTNPVGFDHPNQVSTVEDLARLARAAASQPRLSTAMAQQTATITDSTGAHSYRLINTNQLLSLDETVTGVKTGTTLAAGQVLISRVEREPASLLIVVMGSKNRYADTQALVDWTYQHYEWEWIEERVPIEALSVSQSLDSTVY
jgi:D-alanyl-D-alanine carboxypeptidase (penicillin-binding protein 5/6)